MPRQRPCLGVGQRCPNLTRNPDGRCNTCQTLHNQARGSSTARGYDTTHKALRQQWAPLVATGTIHCHHPGCGQLIQPDEPWDLGHNQQREHRGPEHADCNRGNRPRIANT